MVPSVMIKNSSKVLRHPGVGAARPGGENYKILLRSGQKVVVGLSSAYDRVKSSSEYILSSYAAKPLSHNFLNTERVEIL